MFNKYQVKLFPQRNPKHDKLMKELKKAKVEFFIFTKNEDKIKKMVLKAALNVNINDIIGDMKELNVEVKECIPLKEKSKLSYS